MQYDVSSAQELTAAIAKAQAGDVVVIAAGQYTLPEVDFTASGTAAQPIVVRAAQALTAQITLASTEGLRVTGAYWTFEGLVLLGGCGLDSDCERAVHVVGGADGFTLRGSRLVDFNRQIDVEALALDGGALAPRAGLIEGNEVHDTHARATPTQVAKISVGAGDGWTVRANLVHDFQRVDGAAAYGIVLSGGGQNGVVERNLVLCTHDWVPSKGSTSVGVSLVDHSGGVLRNDVVVACSGDGMAVTRGPGTHLWFDTLIDTTGVDLTEPTTSGEARGNVLGGTIRAVDAGAVTVADNLDQVSPNAFLLMYQAPLDGNLRSASPGSVGAVLGKGPTLAAVTDDYCARPRAVPYDLGALQASLGDCDTVPPPLVAPEGGAPDAGSDAATADDASPGPDATIGGDGGSGAGEQPGGGGGCGCTTEGRAGSGAGALAMLVAVVLALIGRPHPPGPPPRKQGGGA
ncbi:MAG TPA: right-handed parallel beta-helix repeat-containing protein [Polyangiaceae bacterium]